MKKRALSRTYVATAEDLSEVFGYYSLGIRCLNVPSESTLSEHIKRKMNIDPETGVAQSYIIGQLGRSDDSPKGFGKYLVEDALNRLRIASDIVGCRVVRVDCSDDLVDYYEEHGFNFMLRRDQPENKPALNQMVLVL